MKTLTDKIILVASHTSIVGTGIVSSFLLEDATVIFPANSVHTIKRLKDGLREVSTGKLVTLLSDYPDYEKAFEIVDAVMERFGKIDIFVICFDAPTAESDLTETDIKDWEKMIDQNITAFFVGARIVLNLMKWQQQGMFINIVGMNSNEKGTLFSLAGLSASLQADMIKILSREVEKFNVRCHNLFVVNLTSTNLSDTQSAESSQTTPAAIGRYIMDLYECRAAGSESLFQWLPEKPDTYDIYMP